MRTVLVSDILNGTTSMADDINGTPIDISHLTHAALHVVWTGTPAGTWRFQVSNDSIPAGVNKNSLSYSDLTWIDVDTQAGGGAAGSKLFTLANTGAKWVTLMWDDTSSTGTVTKAALHAKG